MYDYVYAICTCVHTHIPKVCEVFSHLRKLGPKLPLKRWLSLALRTSVAVNFWSFVLGFVHANGDRSWDLQQLHRKWRFQKVDVQRKDRTFCFPVFTAFQAKLHLVSPGKDWDFPWNPCAGVRFVMGEPRSSPICHDNSVVTAWSSISRSGFSDC